MQTFDMADSLYLSSHLRPPQYNIGLVDRPRLTELLDRAGARRLLIVHAPAGFGKTTALYQWVTRLQSDATSTVCWLSVTPGDNDPYRFVYHLQCALAEGCKRSGRSGGAADRSFHTTSLRADVDELVRRLAGIRGRLVMIIDDYHLAESPPNNRILNEVVNALDDNMTVVVSSRRKPELALPYFRCQGLLESIDADVLAFSEEESSALFADGGHAGAAEAVCRQAAGWPMALQLAKLWLRDADVNARGSWELDPQASGITDYLSGEVLKQLPGGRGRDDGRNVHSHPGQRRRCEPRYAAVGLLVPDRRPACAGHAHRTGGQAGRVVSVPPVDPGVPAGATRTAG